MDDPHALSPAAIIHPDEAGQGFGRWSGAVALAVQQLLGGWWFIVAGAVAGSVAGGLLDDAE